jgi:YD repeat-containing protein
MHQAEELTISYEYNKFGELIRQTDAPGKLDSMEHDTLGRILTEVRSEGDKAFTYNSVG